MAGKVFINYRRGDASGFAQALFGRLEAAFPPEQLFMDIDSIEPGLDFMSVLEDQVDQCDIFLAVIGPGWIGATDDAGRRRLDDETDFVRLEIESALHLGKRIIPVLVNNAQMPRADQLPASLKPVARRNAVRLTHERFKADVHSLVKQLKKALQDVEAPRAAANAAVAEAKRRIEEAKSAERDREQRHGAHQGSPALSLEQITQADERRDLLKDSLDKCNKEMEVAWESALEADTKEAYEKFLKVWPRGPHSRAARTRFKQLVVAQERESERRTAAESQASKASGWHIRNFAFGSFAFIAAVIGALVYWNYPRGRHVDHEPVPAPAKFFVEIGAENDQTAALAAFADIQQKYPSLLANYRPIVQKVDLGAKGTSYRLHIGPMEDKAQAYGFCSQVKSQGWAHCLVIAQ